MEPPRRLKDLPISAPVWMWLLYVAILITLMLLDIHPFDVAFAAMFSFQFWTFAVWRGLHRQEQP